MPDEPTEQRPRRRGTPAGIDRAERRPDAPPRGIASSPQRRIRVEEPSLAEDAPVDLPKGLRREVDKAVDDAQLRQRVLQHLTAALAALDDRDGATAVPHLRWAKERATRSGLVREALGVALYLSEQYADALTELAAYRRLTGRQDQNHLVADSHRAVGSNEDRIPELVRLLEDDDEADEAARLEGRIVWASWLADAGDVAAGRAVLRHALEATDGETTPPPEAHLRVLYVAGDLAERSGDTAAAVGFFDRVLDGARGFYDTESRRAALGD